jgi:hypothetical protein
MQALFPETLLLELEKEGDSVEEVLSFSDSLQDNHTLLHTLRSTSFRFALTQGYFPCMP